MRRIAVGILGLALLLPAPVAAAGSPGFIQMGDFALAELEMRPAECLRITSSVHYYDGERAGDLGSDPLWTWSDVGVAVRIYDQCDEGPVWTAAGYAGVDPTIVSMSSAEVDEAVVDLGDGMFATVDLTWTAQAGVTPRTRTYGSADSRRVEVFVPADLSGTLAFTGCPESWDDGWKELCGPNWATTATRSQVEIAKYVDRSK